MSDAPERREQTKSWEDGFYRLATVLLATIAALGCSPRLSDSQLSVIQSQLEHNLGEFQSPPANPSQEELQAYRKEYELRMVVSMIEIFSKSQGLNEDQKNALINRVLSRDESNSYLVLQKMFDNQTMVKMLRRLSIIQEAAAYEAARIQYFPAIPRVEGITNEDPNRIIGEPEPPYSHYLQLRQSSVEGDMEPRHIPIPPGLSQEVIDSTFFEEKSLISLVRDAKGQISYTLIIPYGTLDNQGNSNFSGFLMLELNELNIVRSSADWIQVVQLNALQKARKSLTDFFYNVFSSAPKEVVVNDFGEYSDSRLIPVSALPHELRTFGGITTWSLLDPIEYLSKATRNTAPGSNLELLSWFSSLDDDPINYREIFTPNNEQSISLTEFELLSTSSRLNNPQNLTVTSQMDTLIAVKHGDILPIGKSTDEYNLKFITHQDINWMVISAEVVEKKERTDFRPAAVTYRIIAIPTSVIMPDIQDSFTEENISEVLEKTWGTANLEEMQVHPFQEE